MQTGDPMPKSKQSVEIIILRETKCNNHTRKNYNCMPITTDYKYITLAGPTIFYYANVSRQGHIKELSHVRLLYY